MRLSHSTSRSLVKPALRLESVGRLLEATMNTIQRQEHGGQKEGHQLTWADGRRVVFHVAAVMYEFATTIEEAKSAGATVD